MPVAVPHKVDSENTKEGILLRCPCGWKTTATEQKYAEVIKYRHEKMVFSDQ